MKQKSRGVLSALGAFAGILLVALVVALSSRDAQAAELAIRCVGATIDGRFGVIVLEGEPPLEPSTQRLPVDELWIPDAPLVWSGEGHPSAPKGRVGGLAVSTVIEALNGVFAAQTDGDFDGMLAFYEPVNREAIREMVGDAEQLDVWREVVRVPKEWSLRLAAAVDEYTVVVLSTTDHMGAYPFVFSANGQLTTQALPDRVDTVLTDLVREVCEGAIDIPGRLRAELTLHTD